MAAPEPTPADLVTVRLLDFPLDVYTESRSHHDELAREFALLSLGRQVEDEAGEQAHEVPVRLLRLIESLTAQYGGMTAGVNAERDAAIAAGETSIDLTLQVPPSAATAATALSQLLDEADTYCRAGKHLLTLATEPLSLRFRRWYLDQFVDQVAGGAPVPWPDYVDPREVAGSTST